MPYLVLIGMAAVTADLDVSKIWLKKPNEIPVRCQFHASIPWGVSGGGLQLFDRLAVSYPLHGRHPVDDQDAVEVIIFMLDNS